MENKLIIVTLIIFILIYSIFIEPQWFAWSKKSIAIKGLSRPLRILHLSDLHLHRLSLSRIFLWRRLYRGDWDLVVCTGDMVDDDHSVSKCIAKVAKIPARYGRYWVWGNHDYYEVKASATWRWLLHLPNNPKSRDLAVMREELCRSGIQLLEDQSVKVAIDGINIEMTGLEYPYMDIEKCRELANDTRNPDFEIRDPRSEIRSPESESVERVDLRILLTHSICAVEKLATFGYDLILAGHAHGGQVCLPGFGPIVVNMPVKRKHAVGLFKVDKTWFHVTRGLAHHIWTPFRFFCRPEVPTITIETV